MVRKSKLAPLKAIAYSKIPRSRIPSASVHLLSEKRLRVSIVDNHFHRGHLSRASLLNRRETVAAITIVGRETATTMRKTMEKEELAGVRILLGPVRTRSRPQEGH